MLVSKAIEIIRRRINDEYDTGYTDEDLINYINDAVKYLSSALISRNDPILVDEIDVGSSIPVDIPDNFVRTAGGFPVMRKRGKFYITDGSPVVTVKYFYIPHDITSVTESLPFTEEMYHMVIINLACVYALNRHEFDVQQDEALRGQLEQLLTQALGAIT